MGPHSELDPQTDLAKEGEERETLKVQGNNSGDCSVKNSNHNKRTQTQSIKQANRMKERQDMCGFMWMVFIVQYRKQFSQLRATVRSQH